MILQELARHYEVLLKQEKVIPQGWCQANVSYALELDREGQLVGVISQKIPEQRGKKEVQVPKPMKVPEMVTRSSGVAANFLCDNAKYLLGIDKDGTNQRLIQCFEAAKELHLAVLQEVDNEAAQAVKKFFLTWKPEKAGANPELSEKWAEVTEGGNLVFLVNHQYAQDNEEIQTAWAKASKTGETGVEGLCLVAGEKTEISRIHSAIKGVQGAQSSGAALVSFNAPAFESYGKEQSYNAPVGKYAMFAYTTALNHLLAQREYVFTMGDTAIVFWSENGEEVYQRTFLDFMNPGEGNREQIKDFFENLQKGKAKIVKELVGQAVEQGIPAKEVLEKGLLAGMDVVGEKFKNNEVFVPEVLVAARAMNMGASVLKPLLADGEQTSAGKVCIGTVKGDLHDIGKNLVKMMMEGKGLEVVDLGTDVSPETYVETAVNQNCQIICCSALLTTTMPVMGEVVKAAEKAGIRDKVKIMIGGAPVTEAFCEQIGADKYTPDAASAADA